MGGLNNQTRLPASGRCGFFPSDLFLLLSVLRSETLGNGNGPWGCMAEVLDGLVVWARICLEGRREFATVGLSVVNLKSSRLSKCGKSDGFSGTHALKDLKDIQQLVPVPFKSKTL